MIIGLVGMSGEEETTNQRRGGAGGNQTGHGRGTVEERGIGNEMHSRPNKPSGSSTMSGAGKIVSGVKKTKNIILDNLKEGAMTRMILLLIRRSQTLDFQGRSQKTPTHSGE